MADKILIPVVYGSYCENATHPDGYFPVHSVFSAADLTDVHVRVWNVSTDLGKMKEYLKRLYFWFLLGPTITLEWLRRKRKLCCVTAAQVDEESANEDVVNESRGNYIQLGTREDNEGELQPLIRITDNARTDYELTRSDNMCSLWITARVARISRRILRYFPVGVCYVFLSLAAPPVGISSGGWPFFRFDENEENRQNNFWEALAPNSLDNNLILHREELWYHTLSLYVGQSFKSLVFSVHVQ